jgi:hypothetical protein
MSIIATTTTTTASKNLDDMDTKELIIEAMKELQEIKRLLDINSKEGGEGEIKENK